MKNVFKKSDVKSGMLVKARNGMFFTVVDAMVTFDGEVGLAVVSNDSNKYFPLDNYNDDLIFTNNLGFPGNIPEYDIVKVWGHTYPKFAMDNNTRDRKELWVRPKPDDNAKKWDEMTDEEKDAICEKHDFCSGCPYEKECSAEGEDDQLLQKYLKLLKDTREAIVSSNDADVRYMIQTMALLDIIPKFEADYILGYREDIDVEAVKEAGTWKHMADTSDDDSKDEDFLRSVLNHIFN